ncbi:hypothetical protein Pcinc_028755 [Petrolisthes cinctipes]|uniref:Uncharacterized protein n=1 Tax=Petrolisthes cinctipes TaxID=88211 RepID=A0AAE1F2J2_PETCI|nr:hypothetical protein Pcinc_028755 [Petrolisthes cinctipes]
MPQPNTPHSGLRDVNSLGSTLPPRSLFTTTTTTSSFMPATTHCLIARWELPGNHPQKWCAECEKATSKNTAYVICDENDCPNLCHTSCLGDFPVYRCVYTKQLCTQANIPDPVTHVSETTEPHIPPLLDSREQLTNPGSKESQWEG